MKNNLSKVFVNIFLLVFIQSSFAQTLPKNWHNLDPMTDQFMGVSSNKAFDKILKNKKSTPIIVAVIDGGVEVDHPDLAGKIWVNEKEIPGNGIDDDKNGYVDDINGWDFIGGKDGKDVNEDTYEMTRLYASFKKKLEQDPKIKSKDKKGYKAYQAAKKAYDKKYKEDVVNYTIFKAYYEAFDSFKNAAKNKDSVTSDDIAAYTPKNALEEKLKSSLQSKMNYGMGYKDIRAEVDGAFLHYKTAIECHLNLDFESRTIVGDSYDDLTNMVYGNNEVEGPSGDHGTHVAGIIAAIRNNDFGAEGVSENVKIMCLRAVPDGDERDKDVANAIRYAVMNGAKIINMSFGKQFSPQKEYVDEAVKFAVRQDVLLVHAAGNDALDVDKKENNFYPNAYYADGKTNATSNWIEVGAIGSNAYPADFSNYGKKKVDVFAPGVDIYSTVPDYKYKHLDGTSMAAPVTSGVAALLWSYFPELTAAQVKIIITSSVLNVNIKVPVPGNPKKMKSHKDLCSSGGMVNVMSALLLAQQYMNSKEKK